jgi:predicted kinase
MERSKQSKLYFLCGKMASGKSTLAKELAQREQAILLVEDELLRKLFPEEIIDIGGYIKYSSRLKDALADHICSLLLAEISVILDFPGNTKNQRMWFRELFERANAGHELHFIDAADNLCKRQLKERSKDLPEGSAFTTDTEFEAITKYFLPPSDDEDFNVIKHRRQ